MRRSKVLEERRMRVNPEIRDSVALSFRIIDRLQPSPVHELDSIVAAETLMLEQHNQGPQQCEP